MIYADPKLTINTASLEVTLDGTPIPLTRKEAELLAALAANAGETVSRRFLLQNVWGYPASAQTRTIDVHIRRLRKKLGSPANEYIETVFNVGYRFRKPRSGSAPVLSVPFAMTA